MGDGSNGVVRLQNTYSYGLATQFASSASVQSSLLTSMVTPFTTAWLKAFIV
jgi:hypothetical protein